MTQSFSERHGYQVPEPDITVREEAPEGLRSYLVDVAYAAGYTEQQVRTLAFPVLHVSEDPGAWGPGWIDQDVRYRLRECLWFRVYDVIEALAAPTTSEAAAADLEYFAREMNFYFRANGIGWQVVNGQIESRGAEPFEHTVRGALNALEETQRSTALGELREAINDLSRRPDADLTGAVQHAMTALECTARDVTGDTSATLGEIIKRYPELIPKPLDTAVEKAWGYASNRGRHLAEGGVPAYREAELIVGIASVLCLYLAGSAEP